FTRKNFLTILASGSDSSSEPRCWRFICCGRLTRPWRLREGFIRTLPVAVSEKRFLAPLLVFILGILASLECRVFRSARLGMPDQERWAAGKRTRGYTEATRRRQAAATTPRPHCGRGRGPPRKGWEGEGLRRIFARKHPHPARFARHPLLRCGRGALATVGPS